MHVIIDPDAGACSGVCRAIRLVEDHLDRQDDIIALGDVIHNQKELDRLAGKGLETMAQDDIKNPDELKRLEGRNVFIRSHGVSPAVRNKLIDAGVHIIDGTCPTVKKVQKEVEHYSKKGYQIIILGKPDHPEVIGILGYCHTHGIVIQNDMDIESIDMNQPSVLVAQTTMAHDKFLIVKEKLSNRMKEWIAVDTTCRYIQKRQDQLSRFAGTVDVLVLVGGRTSSNTRILFEICKKGNPASYWIESEEQVQAEWFHKTDVIGITGSASTPMWQLEKTRKYISMLAP
jgi:4-hydroxy-3-methylbut-2-en-1-yl diphosphate reductase